MATFTVTTTADTTAGDGSLSLREALAEADAAPGADTIDFDLAAIGGNEIVLAGSELTIRSEVTIDGGTGVVLDANSASGVLLIRGPVPQVTLESLVITGGFADSGAGIQTLGASRLTLVDCTVTRNATPESGGDGAGIQGDFVTLVGSTVSGNMNADRGGGIYAGNRRRPRRARSPTTPPGPAAGSISGLGTATRR